jgi:hypothetical protein
MIISKYFSPLKPSTRNAAVTVRSAGERKYSSMFPNVLREQPRKGSKDRDIFCLQGRYELPLGRVFALAYPAFC